MIFNTGVSVSDYFKQKMEQKKKNSGLLAIETPESSFGEPSTSITKDLDLDINETVESETSKPEAEIKKSKKKKKKSLEAEIVAPESEDVIPENSLDDNSEKPKKKKRKAPETEAEQKDENDPIIEQLILAFEQDSENDKLKTKKIKKKKCKDKHNEVERPADERTSEETPKKKKSKSKSVKEEEAIEITEEIKTKKSKKKKRSQSTEETPEEPESKSKKQKLVEVPKPKTFGPEYITGMNVVYSTNVIQITSLTAKKLTNLAIKDFPDSNCANIVGYGLSEEIELKTVQTQMVDEKSQLDKYSLYNMVTSRDKIAPKKMLAKLRKPKNSFSVL